MKTKIFITGSSGFVGGHLSNYLENRFFEIKTVSLRETSWKYSIDNTGEAIIHLAGKAHDTQETSSENEYFKVNRDLTIDLFREFLKSEIRDFFYFSSVKAVADTVDKTLIEEIEGNPQTPYGKSKFEAEQYLLSQKLPLRKRLFIIRPCMIHGPGNKGNLNLLYKLVEKGIPWPLASFENQRSFLSIVNLNFLVLELLKNTKVSSGIYNFADDESLSTNQVVGLISEASGNKPQLWKIPAGLIIQMSKVGDVLHLPLNSERLKKLTESYLVSNHKIKSVLGINQLPLSAEDGLRLTIGSFKNSGNDTTV